MKKILFTIAILAIYTSTFSQNIKLKMADKYFESFAYMRASELYESLAAQNIEMNHVSKRLAACYYNTNQTVKAEEWFSQVMSQEEVEAEDVYKYAQTLRQNKKYGESEKWMKRFYQMDANDSRAKEFMNRGNILEEIKSQGERCTLKNLGLNTENCEFGGVYHDNQLIFTASREEGVATKRKFAWNELPFLDLFSVAKEKMDSANKAVLMTRTINSKFHEGPVTFNADGTRAYFTRNNYHKGRYGKDQKGVNKLKIFWSENTNNEWSKINSVHFNSDEYSVGHPSLTADGKRLYFVSDMPGGIGGTDIYYASVNEDGTLGEPINLGKEINTEGDEMFPYIHHDGTLFFSSEGHIGLGGLDIFYAIPDSKGDYSEFKNAGMPMNSAKDDFAFYLSDDDETGFVSSNREGGKGNDDIYFFKLLKPFKEQYLVKGVTVDKETGEILANTGVELKDVSGNVMGTVVTGTNGTFSFSIEGDMKYELVGAKEKYTNDMKNISTIGMGENRVIEANLELVLKRVAIYGVITDKKTGKLLEGVNVILINKETNKEELNITTNSTADFRHALKNVQINDNITYDIKLAKEGYLGKTATLNKKITQYGEIPVHKELNVALDKIDVGADLAKIVDLKPIYFDLGKWNIRTDAATELDKIVKVMNENPQMVIELGSHTDSRGSATSNYRLSDRRAKSSAQYIIQKGIDKSRITGKGFGESKLVNKCKDGVKCTEDEHQQNRRTEFIIVKM